MIILQMKPGITLTCVQALLARDRHFARESSLIEHLSSRSLLSQSILVWASAVAEGKSGRREVRRREELAIKREKAADIIFRGQIERMKLSCLAAWKSDVGEMRFAKKQVL